MTQNGAELFLISVVSYLWPKKETTTTTTTVHVEICAPVATYNTYTPNFPHLRSICLSLSLAGAASGNNSSSSPPSLRSAGRCPPSTQSASSTAVTWRTGETLPMDKPLLSLCCQPFHPDGLKMPERQEEEEGGEGDHAQACECVCARARACALTQKLSTLSLSCPG